MRVLQLPPRVADSTPSSLSGEDDRGTVEAALLRAKRDASINAFLDTILSPGGHQAVSGDGAASVSLLSAPVSAASSTLESLGLSATAAATAGEFRTVPAAERYSRAVAEYVP